ncbi:unnamed protein product [Paramecium sonneborni]|uniref:Uncharacterized protein n=1 Tax=Paramecium sonneborni TaxID=65129 RepID=A0A8S1Q385_9CILI|nr:unnamed protein product [Paramecium sonneborni]
MNTQNVSNLFKSTIQEKGLLEIEIDSWNKIQERIVKTKIRIAIAQDNYLLYFLNGVVYRKLQQFINLNREQIVDDSQNLEILTNLDQIKYLQWLGEYRENKRKFGKWIATWNMEVVKDVGGYYDNGLKQGLWNEPIKNYCSQSQVYERGIYFENQKRGSWIFLKENKRFGGGQYNNQGQKIGKWIELNDQYNHLSQVTCKGEYKNGKRVGKWEYYMLQGEYKLIGVGIYQEMQEESIKNGKWIELGDGFNLGSQVILIGNYSNGKKVGSWNFYWNDNERNELKGGGLYDGSIKIGVWNELINNFGSRQGQSQIIYNGEYHNDKKVGSWNILYQEFWEKNFQKIGGGFYNDQGSIKIGNWIEVSENYGSKRGQSFVTYNGEYKNDQKVGRWDILYKYYNDGWKKEQIGGGQYDLKCSFKIGMWIEVSDGFEMNMQVINKGYYQNGEKVGRWDILHREWGREKFEKIGGGSYGEKGSFKIGEWIELVDGSIVSYKCEYKDSKENTSIMIND